MINCISFDMDGIIIDSQSALDIYEFEFYRKITNNAWTKKEQQNIHGMSIKGIYKLMKSKYKIKVSLNTFINEYNKILVYIYKKKCKLVPGVKSLLKDCMKENFKVGLASSTSHKYIKKVLNRFKLNKYFDTVVSGDDTPGKTKPQPDIFLLTATKLSFKPKNCLVFEDSSNGVTAAKRAGMYCIQFSIMKKIVPPFPNLHIKSFKTLTINKLIKKLKN